MTTDIAIVGMSGLFPGARNIHEYWQNIINKVDCVREAPDEWSSPYFDPNVQPREDPARIYTRKVGLLGKLAEFNPLEFGIPPNAVDGDPSHFLSLKLARDALQDANYIDRPFNRQKTGVILGRGANPNRGDVTGVQLGLVMDQTMDIIQQLLPHLDRETLGSIRQELMHSLPSHDSLIEKAPTLVSNVAAGRIANRLDLMGPNYLIDAACSSCLIAVELAINELSNGHCDMILVGGVQGSMPPQIYQLFCQLGALSRSNIRPFSQAANGTLLSEGVGFLVLKRLDYAQQDNDRIYAVIKGVGTSSDGKALGLLAPRLEGEILALQRAYERTGIDPQTIDLIECHGTGIPLGDKTEIQALTHLFGQRQGNLPRCAIGSVKSMIGHCIPASGVASLIKIALSLYHKVLPPTLCDEVNPALEIERTPLYVNTEMRPWIHAGNSPRRAGVNAFGFGGINAHAVLEEYIEARSIPSATPLPVSFPPTRVWKDWSAELIILSGQGRSDILALIDRLQNRLAEAPELNLADLAFTLCQQTQGTHRLAVIAENILDLQQKLKLAADKLTETANTKFQSRNGVYYAENQTVSGKIAFLLSSEGAQYPNMLADLCLYFPQVREWFDLLDEAFPRENPPCRLIFPPPTSLTAEQREWVASELFAADLATESLFAASMGLYELLRGLGVQCDLMVGHSAGEHVAATASGLSRVSSREHLIANLRGLNQVYADLEATNSIPTGTVLSVGAVDYSWVEQLMEEFSGNLYLVADNCPNQVLLFATKAVSDTVAARVKEAGGICVPLPFDRAYHTPLFAKGAEALWTFYRQVDFDAHNSVPLYSCATTELYPSERQAGGTLAIQQWSLPVRFREMIEKLYDQGVRTFIEVGAGSNLTAFVDNTLKGRDYLAIASNTPKKSALKQIYHLLAKLFVQGGQLNFATLYQHRNVRELNLDMPIASGSKPSPVLNLLLPRLILDPAFVASIEPKLSPPLPSNPSANPLPAITPETPPLSPSLVFDRALTPHRESPLSEAPVPQPEEFAPDPNLTAVAFLPQEDFHAAILQGHFQLMQEFLANQGKVASKIFSGQETNGEWQ
jgi:acyl transferase domain-containing protein